MAEQAVSDEELELDDVLDDQDEDENQQEDRADEDEESEGVLVISFADEAAPASTEEDKAPEWVRNLRKENRELQRRLAEVEAAKAQPRIEVGEKPTLETCDYDEGRFETELDAWKERKRQADEAQTQAQKDAEAAQAEWQRELQALASKEAALKAPDYAEARDDVSAALSNDQQATLVLAADNAAHVIYALGKHPQRLAALAAIKHPIKLAKAIVQLERDLKVTTRRKGSEPEEIVRGSAPLSASSDKHEERLEKEAERTGDRTKLIAYRKKRKAQAKS